MTREQFVTIIELSQDVAAKVGICKGVGVDLNSISDALNKIIKEYFNYVDPEEKGLPIVMFFIHNGYYPLPDGDKIIELRDISKLYEFWIICIEHGNPVSKHIVSAVNDYKKDLE